MSWFRRRRRVEVTPAPAPEPAAAETLPEVATAARLERALVALAVHAQQLDTRLERLERRVDADADAMLDLPTQADIVDVQVHGARVAAELTRLSVELRGEIATVAAQIRRDDHDHDPERDRRLLALASTLASPEPPTGALHAHVVDLHLPPAAASA